MILISNNRTSTSKKINGMALIRTLTVSTTTFERMKEKFFGFRQTVSTSVPEKWPLFKLPFENEVLGQSGKSLHGFDVTTDMPLVTGR